MTPTFSEFLEEQRETVSHNARLIDELVQVAAVTVCWLEAHGFNRDSVYTLVSQERDSQDAKWGSQRHHSGEKWLAILTEEVGEVAKEVLEGG